MAVGYGLPGDICQPKSKASTWADAGPLWVFPHASSDIVEFFSFRYSREGRAQQASGVTPVWRFHFDQKRSGLTVVRDGDKWIRLVIDRWNGRHGNIAGSPDPAGLAADRSRFWGVRLCRGLLPHLSCLHGWRRRALAGADSGVTNTIRTAATRFGWPADYRCC